MRTVSAVFFVVAVSASAQQLERQAPSCAEADIARSRAGADAGDAASIYLMARHLSTGKCMPGDGKGAIALYWRAAEKNYAPAYYNLGRLSAGWQDFEAAELMFFKGAQLGHRGSELELGTLYMLAPPPVRNDEKALAWLSVTAARAEPISVEASERLDIVRKRVSTEVRVRGENLGRSLSIQFAATPPFVAQ